MFHISNLFAPIRLPSDASSQPDPAPLNLTIDIFQDARSGLPGLKFLPPHERQLALATYDPHLFDNYLELALDVCECGPLKSMVEATFRVLTGQSRPVGFEAAIRALMTPAQATLSLPDTIKAIIDVGALITFAQQNPDQAMSSPEVLRMLIFGLAMRGADSDQGDAFCDAVDQRYTNLMCGNGGAEGPSFTVVFNYEPLAKPTRADDETLTEQPGVGTEEWSESDLVEMKNHLEMQPRRSLSDQYPTLLKLLENVPGASAEVVGPDGRSGTVSSDVRPQGSSGVGVSFTSTNRALGN